MVILADGNEGEQASSASSGKADKQVQRGVVPLLPTTATTRATAVLILFVVLLLAFFFDVRAAYAVTLTVNSTADPGTGGCNTTECTSREAINVSNGLPTTDTIEFRARFKTSSVDSRSR